MNVKRLRFLLTDSRWAWFLRGLPSLERARALFLARNYTMTSHQRCKNLWDICRSAIDRKIPGGFVECGVWLGGSAAIMGLAVKNASPPRELHLFDSFEGLPEPGPEDGAKAETYSGVRGSGKLVPISRCEVNVNQVRSYLIDQLGLDPKTVHFHVGWFQDTLPARRGQIPSIAVLRLDGDWYASTRVCLEQLYPLLSPGGVLILDDYRCWEGCQKATDEYRKQQGISAPLIPLDNECCYWIKP